MCFCGNLWLTLGKGERRILATNKGKFRFIKKTLNPSACTPTRSRRNPWSKSAEDVLCDNSRQKELLESLKCQILLNDELEVTIF